MKKFAWGVAIALACALPARAGTPVTLPSGRVLVPTGQTVRVGNLPTSCALSPDGRWLAVLHGGKDDHSVDLFDTRKKRVVQTLPLPDSFHGLAFSPDGKRLWVSGAGTHGVWMLDRRGDRLVASLSLPVPGYPAGLAISDDGRRLYAVDNAGDRVTILPLSGSEATASLRVGATPFAVVSLPGGGAAVAGWGSRNLSLIRPAGGLVRVPVGTHPTALAMARHDGLLYVANANRDTVSVVDPKAARMRRTWTFQAYPGAPLGSSPTALALSPDETRLYVALAGLNAVAVVSTRTGRELGRIPTAWYPAGLAVSRDGRALYVVCAKGFGTGPRRGPRPTWDQDGVIETVPVPSSRELARLTRAVARANGFDRSPVSTGWLPPIRHVVYVVRENRTYDQVLGDLPQADGDPSLTVFGRPVTPNLHALAERFAFGDRFFCDGEVSAQGHQWTQGGPCTDAVERLWPPVYDHKSRWIDADDPLVYPDSEYLIDRCVARRVSCRMYGDFVRRDGKGEPLPALRSIRCPSYVGWNLKLPDRQRVAAWEAEFKRGLFPAFSYLWLPNDHTAGTKPGRLTPRAMVAENDLATGRLVDVLSHDPRWKDTLVIIQEDDAQAGYDHVDGHRSLLVLASPWIRSGTVTSRHYDQAAVVATVCRLLKLGPLSQYDAHAPIITDVWSRTPDLRPFTAIAPQVSLTERNGPRSPMASASLKIDLSKPDQGDQALMARILWESRR